MSNEPLATHTNHIARPPAPDVVHFLFADPWTWMQNVLVLISCCLLLL